MQDIGRIYKAVVADLQLKEKGDFKSEVGSIHPENFLRRFMSMLGFNNQDMKAAVDLANVMVPKVIPNRSPSTQSGSVLHCHHGMLLHVELNPFHMAADKVQAP